MKARQMMIAPPTRTERELILLVLTAVTGVALAIASLGHDASVGAPRIAAATSHETSTDRPRV